MDFGSFLHIILTGIVLLVTICVLVAAHEYGHYITARLFGMGVEEFAIGFGRKPIWTWMRKTYAVEEAPGPAGKVGIELPETWNFPTDGSGALQPQPISEPSPSQVKLSATETTDFTVRPWPLGGFVRIKGMIPEEDGSEIHVPGGFYSKAPWKRFIVLLAGPVFSVLAGIFIFIGVFWTGGDFQRSKEPIFGTVVPGNPAAKAGLKEGDRILSVDGSAVSTFYDITKIVSAKGGKKITIEFQRDGKVDQVSLTPLIQEGNLMKPDMTFEDETKKVGRIGVGPKNERVPLSFLEAVKAGFAIPGTVLDNLSRLVKKPSQLKEAVGGPGSIAMATSQATKGGIEDIILLAAGLSVSVGIFNLLPIPPLDGGQMLVAVAEMLRGGRRLSIKVQGAVAAVGLALVAMLFVSVIVIDVGRISKANENSSKVIEKKDK